MIEAVGRQEVFYKKGAAGLQLIKKETLAQVFSCDFCEISKSTFLTEHLWTTASKFSNETLWNS